MMQHYQFVPNQVRCTSSNHMATFTCKVSGTPKPQARCFANTRTSSKKVTMINQSAEHCQSFRHAFSEAIAASQQTPFQLKSGLPVKITVRFYFSRPQSHYRYENKQLVLSKSCPTYVTKVPDLDNLLKLLLDALQGVCYDNDMVVAHIDSAKLYDPSQTYYNKSQVGGGCTIIKISQINQNESEPDCTCLSCKPNLQAGNT